MSETDRQVARVRIQDIPDQQPASGPELLFDSQENVRILAKGYSKAKNELSWMHTAGYGLSILASSWTDARIHLRNKNSSHPKVVVDFEWCHSPVMALVYQWFSVTASNFADAAWAVLVGSGVSSNFYGGNREQFRKDVLGPLLPFRNKVGAHLAVHRSNKRDTKDDELFAAASGSCVMVGDDVYIPVTRINASGDEVDSELKPWSLGQEYSRIYDRFFASLEDQKTAGSGGSGLGVVSPVRDGQYGSRVNVAPSSTSGTIDIDWRVKR